MLKFHTTSNCLQEPTSEEIVEALLVEAGTANELPTNEEKLLQFLGLQQLSFDFMHELDFVPSSVNPSPGIRAVLSLNDRLIATQTGLSDKRKRFGVFHEIAHYILPEHRDKLFFLDTDATLTWWTKARIEREANETAAELVFQGNRFTEESLSAPTSIRIPIELAPKYGASFESALRRYAEHHVLPCALIVYDKVKSSFEDGEVIEDPDYRIHYTITSGSFRKNYFSGLEVKGEVVKGSELLPRGKWWSVEDIVESELTVGRGRDKAPWRFQTEIFSNSYKVFQFVLPSKESLQI